MINIKKVRVISRHAIAVNAVAAQVCRCNLRLTRLIDIEELEQFRPRGPDISHLQDKLASQLLLNVQIEILHVRRAHVGIDGKEITFRAIARIDGHSRDKRCSGYTARGQRLRP